MVDLAIVYAVRKDGVKFSVRSEIRAIDAGSLVHSVLEEYGNGGGHQAMAGGFIPAENLQKIPAGLCVIEEKFMQQAEQMKRGIL